MNTTPIDRARALARARGIPTRAATLRGLLTALRTSRSRPAAPAWRHTYTAADLAALVAGYAQGRARTRRIDPYLPLAVAMAAAFGRDTPAEIPAVPSRYRGNAMASYAAARRVGDAVLLNYGRAACPHTPYGRGGHTITGEYGAVLRASTLRRLLPAPPAGCCWSADHLGVLLRRLSDGAEIHPSPALLHAIMAREPHGCVHGLASALAANATRRNAVDAAVDAAVARASEARVTLADSLAAGNCPAGTRTFARRLGLDLKTAYPGDELLRKAGPDTHRVALAIHAALRRQDAAA